MSPVHSLLDVAIPEEKKAANAVQHVPILCVSCIAVSLQSDRHNPPGINVATGLEQAEKLISILLLYVAQQMLGIDTLANEDKYLLRFVCV